jgi:hypothetical protein
MATVEAESGVSDYPITALSIQQSEGDREVEERLISLVYDELHRLTGDCIYQKSANNTTSNRLRTELSITA